MKTVTIILVAITIIAIIVIFGMDKKIKNNKHCEYKKKKTLLNKNEQEFFWVLVKALPELLVLPQVSMNQIFSNTSLIQRNLIGQNSIDFMICKRDFKMLVAIELNGPSHKTESQKRRDLNKANALKSASIPLLIYENHNIPNAEQVRNDVIRAIQS